MVFAIAVDLKCDSCVGDSTSTGSVATDAGTDAGTATDVASHAVIDAAAADDADSTKCGGASCQCCAGALSKACATPHRVGIDGGADAFVASAERIRISRQRGLATPALVGSPSLVAIFVPPKIIDPVVLKQLGEPSDTATLDSNSAEEEARSSKSHGAQGDGDVTKGGKVMDYSQSANSTDAAIDGSDSNGAAENHDNDGQDQPAPGPQHECGCVSWVRQHEENGHGRPLDAILPKIHPSLAGLIVKGIVSTCGGSDMSKKGSAYDLVIIEVPKINGVDTVANIMDEAHGDCMASVSHAVIEILKLSRISFGVPNGVVPTETKESESTTATSKQIDSSQHSRRDDDDNETTGLIVPEIPSCPVCLHRIGPQRLGWPRPKNEQLCSQFCAVIPPKIDASIGHDACSNTRFLTPWPPPSHCMACSVIWAQWQASSPDDLSSAIASNSFESNREPTLGYDVCTKDRKEIRCYKCGMKETLWVCLTCGVIGCGRYSLAHAKEHNRDTGHPYSLELVTQRIWDYTTGEFAQRGDLLDCSSMRHRLGKNHRPGGYGVSDSSSSTRPVRKDADGFQDYREFERMNGEHGSLSNSSTLGQNFHPDDPSPKKATMVGEEYEALLQSALEDQAQHYEGEISRLIADLTAERVDDENMSDGEMSEVDTLRKQISDLRSEADSLSKQLLDAQGQEAGHRATYQRLLREQAVAKDLLATVKEEAKKEHDEGKTQLEDMEQQVEDLTANLKMARQIAADKELSNAQIFGTTSVPSTKPPKRGKKHRRLLRKK